MSKIILAAMVAAALALAGLQGGGALAQTPPAKPATEKSDAETKTKSDKKAKASAARTAARERQKQCGTEWREAKKAGKIEKNQTWPKFWSACNARLKPKAG
jgi:hypothetical protein